MAGKKKSGSSARASRTAKSAPPIRDKDIDFSDIPLSTDDELRRMRRVKPLRDKRTVYSIHLQLSPALLAELERVAKRSKKTCAAVARELVAAGLKRAA